MPRSWRVRVRFLTGQALAAGGCSGLWRRRGLCLSPGCACTFRSQWRPAGRGLGIRESSAAVGWPEGLPGRGAERQGDREHRRPEGCGEGDEHGRRGRQERDGLLREALRRRGLRSSASPANSSSASDASSGEGASAERDASASLDAAPGERAASGGQPDAASPRRVARALEAGEG